MNNKPIKAVMLRNNARIIDVDGVITVTDFDTSQKRGTEAIDLMTARQTGISSAAGRDEAT